MSDIKDEKTEDNIDNNTDEQIDDIVVDIELETTTETILKYDDDQLSPEIEIDTIEIEDDLKKNSKHKEVGKHALKYDSIFKGKKEDSNLDEYFIESASKNNNTFEPDAASSYSFERDSPTEYTRLSQLKKDMYEVIVNDIKLNLKSSRRKPSRADFNKFYSKIVNSLDMNTYSYSEVFMEFAYYFSDNIENMFKMLDKKWGGKIAMELAKRGNVNGAKNLEDIDFL
jgi:hypothetical protein